MEKILNSNPQQVNIALLVDSFEVFAWEYNMLQQIIKEKHGKISLVLINEHIKEKGIATKYALYNWFLKYHAKKYRVKNNSFAKKNAKSLLSGLPVITVSNEIPSLENQNIDLIIKLGSKGIPKELFALSKFGIWSHHRNIGRKLVAPDGFWEVIYKRPTTETRLFSLSENKADSKVIYKSSSSTHDVSVNHNINTAYWKASLFIPRMLKNLQNKGIESTTKEKTITKKSNNPSISNVAFLFPVMKYFINFLNHKLSKKLTKENWVLLYNLEDGDTSTYDFKKYKKLIPPKGTFWADPFIIERNNRFYIFLEVCNTKIGAKGIISVIEMDKKGHHSAPVNVLKKDYHLSYPFMFEWEDALYMIPETGQNATIELYKCTNFPLQWEFQHNLMDKVMAYDSTLFFHNNRWWLFTNMKQNMEMSSWDELYLFHADTPMSQEWIPHPLNPIISDVTKARPAGNIFMKEGKIYRPSQNSAYKYGYGLKINKIIKLTETEYKEVTVESIIPNWDKSVTTIHTYNKIGKLTLIDGMFRG